MLHWYTNTLPWFSVDLPDSTSDDIEVHICHNQATTDEDSPIQLLELYIQWTACSKINFYKLDIHTQL